MSQPMTYRAHAKALTLLGLPLVGSHLAQLFIGITDSLMLGWYSAEALAAVTLAGSMFFVIFIVGSGFAFAVLPMVARAVTEGDSTQARRVTRMGLWVSTLYGLVMMLPMIFAERLLLAMGQRPEIAAAAGEYLVIAAFGLVPALGVMVLKNFLAALERTGIVLGITLLAVVLNAALNWVLIFGKFGLPELGLEGAAIASVLMQFASVALFLGFIRVRVPGYALMQRVWRADGEALGRVFRLGWPIGLTNLAESGLFSATAVLMGWVGTLPLAAHGVALHLASLSFMAHLGISQAATVRAGQAFARGDRVELRRGAATASMMSVVAALLAAAVFLLFPEFLISLFLAPDEPEKATIIGFGIGLLAMAALFQLVDGAQVVALGLLRGLQDTKVPMVHAAISYWLVGIPCCYVFGFILGWDGIGIWFGLVIGLACAAALLMHRFWTRTAG